MQNDWKLVLKMLSTKIQDRMVTAVLVVKMVTVFCIEENIKLHVNIFCFIAVMAIHEK